MGNAASVRLKLPETAGVLTFHDDRQDRARWDRCPIEAEATAAGPLKAEETTGATWMRFAEERSTATKNKLRRGQQSGR